MEKKVDYSEDLSTLQKFVEDFENLYFDKLGLRVYSNSKARDYVGFGATKIYNVSKPKNYVDTKNVRNLGSSMLWLTSDINPHGITDSTDIGRTFTIQFEIHCEERPKFKKLWTASNLIKFYSYGRTIPEILAKFKAFTETEKFVNLFIK